MPLTRLTRRGQRRPDLPGPRKVPLSRRVKNDWPILLMALPGLVYFVTFYYVPLVGNVIAFKDYQPFLGIRDSEWVGWDNFAILTSGDPDFVRALANTLVITFLQLVIVFPAPILLALTINSVMVPQWKSFVQSVVYLPHFLSWVVVIALFQNILGWGGPLEALFSHFGWGEPDIIGNPSLFKPLLILEDMWKNVGWGTILFLAALTSIDQNLYEAAEMDGASKWRQTWHVTLPGIRPVVILILILRIGDLLNVGFEQILLQQPSVGLEVSEVLDTYVYNNGIVGGEWGTSAAVGLTKGILAVILVTAANKLAHAFGEAGLYQGRPK